MQVVERMFPELTPAAEAVIEMEEKAEEKIVKDINSKLVKAHRREEEKRNNWRRNLPKKTKMRRW